MELKIFDEKCTNNGKKIGKQDYFFNGIFTWKSIRGLFRSGVRWSREWPP